MLTIMKGTTKMVGILEAVSVRLKAHYDFYLNVKISLSVTHKVLCNSEILLIQEISWGFLFL